jgi:hypothetical protein
MRCYNGCPDSELQAILDIELNFKEKLTAINPDAKCIYFPSEDHYIVFIGVKGLWDTESNSLVKSITLATQMIREISWIQNVRYAAANVV